MGLRPYGLLEDGSVPVGPKYLKVLSVTGGPAGTVFVGYEGQSDCESNYYAGRGQKNPNIYKSGDADKVVLTPTGLHVVHYDISSGPGVVEAESGGREKICSVLRIAWDKAHGNLWFGANHAFAWGDPDLEGSSTPCDGSRACSGVMEHTHPYITAKDATGHQFRLTDAYHGVAVRPDGDVWFGGANRTTRFRFMTVKPPRDFEGARKKSETRSALANRIDVWPDKVDEVGIPGPEDRVDDNVSDLALMPDGSLWAASFAWGLAHLSDSGTVLQYALTTGPDRFITSLVRDPSDNSLWAGLHWGGGLTRLQGETVVHYGTQMGPLADRPVWDLYVSSSGMSRRLLVAFGMDERGGEGGIGIYRGP